MEEALLSQCHTSFPSFWEKETHEQKRSSCFICDMYVHEDCLDLLLLSLQTFPTPSSLHPSFSPSLLKPPSSLLSSTSSSSSVSFTQACSDLSHLGCSHLPPLYTPQKPPPPPPTYPVITLTKIARASSQSAIVRHVLAYFLTSSLFLHFQYSMFLTTAAPLRRGSTPLPVKHQLRREEAISEDCDWIPGLEEPATLPITDTALPRDQSFSQSAAAQSSYSHSHGVLRIVLLGQNGVGKSSLALSLAGQSDRSLSIDSETQACGKELLGLGQAFSTCMITCAEPVSF